MNIKYVTAAALIAAATSAAALEATVGDTIGTDPEEVRAMLEAQGYKVLEIETEDDELEVEYEADGQVYEMEIELASGLISEIELDDDED